MSTWGKDKIIKAIQEKYSSNNCKVKRSDFKNNPGYPSATTIDKYFGSFNNALISAGITPNVVPTKWDKSSIIKSIRLLTTKNGKILPASYFNNPENSKEIPYIGTIINHFGSYNNALLEAGLDVTVAPKNKWSDKDIINSIILFENIHGRPPYYREIKSYNGFPNISTIINRFGSFNNALTSAGIEVRTNSGFGIPSISKDGHIYRSQAEAYFVDNYLLDKFKYEIEPKYPEPLKWKYDWVLTDLNIYIELSGGLRPQRLLDKKELNISLGIKCIFIDTSNIYKNNWVFDPIKELNCVIPKTLARLSGEAE